MNLIWWTLRVAVFISFVGEQQIYRWFDMNYDNERINVRYFFNIFHETCELLTVLKNRIKCRIKDAILKKSKFSKK